VIVSGQEHVLLKDDDSHFILSMTTAISSLRMKTVISPGAMISIAHYVARQNVHEMAASVLILCPSVD
jgi:hypothetical protein